MQQEVLLAMLAKEPSHGYELRARLRQALGPLGEAMNAGQIYVTLTRLEKAGLIASEQAAGLPDRPDRKVYALTPDGQQRVAGWLADLSWPNQAEFHLKLVAAAAARLADPLTIVDAQRRAILRRLAGARRAGGGGPPPRGRPWMSPIPRPPGCCWRDWFSACRPTCTGWKPANGTGRAGHDRAAAEPGPAAGPEPDQELRPRDRAGPSGGRHRSG